MANSVNYEVVARYRVRAEQAKRDTARLAQHTDRLARSQENAKRTGFGLAGAFKAMVAVGVVGFLGRVIAKMGKLKQTAENATISIAGTFKTFDPKLSFGQAMDRANAVLERFRSAAITSPATSDDFISVFQNASAPISDLNLNNEAITDLIKKVVPAALSYTGGDYAQAGRDLREVLQGRINADNRTFSALRQKLLEGSGVKGVKDVKGYNKAVQQDPQVALRAVRSALGAMDDVNVAFGKSYIGLSSSITEYLDRFGRRAGDGPFNALKRHMSDLVDWFEKNQVAIGNVADKIGGVLTKGINLAAAGAKLLYDNLTAVLVVSTALAARQGIGMMGGIGVLGRGASLRGGAASFAAQAATARASLGARAAGAGRAVVGGGKRAIGGAVGFAGDMLFGNAIGGPAAGRAGARIARIPGAIKAAPSAMWGGAKAAGAVGMMAPGAGLAKIFGAGGLLGQGSAIVGFFSTLTGSLTVLGTTLLPVIIVIGMIIGTFRVFKDKTNEATQFFHLAVSELMAGLDQMTMMFGGGGFSATLKKFFDWLGTGVVGTLGFAVKALALFVDAINWVITAAKGFFYGMGNIINVAKNGSITDLFDADVISMQLFNGFNQADKERRAAERQALLKRDSDKKKEQEQDARDKAKKKGKPQVNVKIVQNIKTDANPDRIAFKVGEVVRKVAEKFPTSVSGLPGVSG